MKHLIKALLVVGLLLLGGHASVTSAAEENHVKVTVDWDDPKGFTDIDAGVESRMGFSKRVMKALDKHFVQLGQKFPKGYSWQIRVSDLDLAGKVTSSYWGGREALRVMDTFFNPSITISYLVKDESGKIVAGDKNFKLTDSYVKSYPSERFMRRPFSYEKHMIKMWFNKILLPFVENS